MDEWEHLFVTAVTYGGKHRPWKVNGQVLGGWEQIEIAKYSEQVGEQGWELSGVATSDSVSDKTTRLIFRRRRL